MEKHHNYFPYLSAAATGVQLAWNAWKNHGNYGYYELRKQKSQKKMARFRQRKRQRRYRRTFRRRSRFARLRKRIRRINRTLYTKGIKSAEIKYRFDSADGLCENVWTSGSTWNHLTDIPIGTNPNARIGGKIFIRHLNMRFHLKAGITSTADNEQYVRIMIIRFNNIQTSTNWSAFSSIPDLQTLFDSAVTNDIDYQMQPYHKINNRYSKGFTILYNKLVKVSKETGADFEQRAWRAKIRVMKPCHWGSADTNGVTDVGPGQIVAYAWDNESSLNAADHPFLKMGCRISFTDC